MTTYPDDVIAHRGQFVLGDLLVDFETRQPAYGQWVAIGLLRTWDTNGFVSVARHCIVGVGRTEQQAIDDLRSRARQDAWISDDDFAVPWAIPDSPAPAEV